MKELSVYYLFRTTELVLQVESLVCKLTFMRGLQLFSRNRDTMCVDTNSYCVINSGG